MCSWFEQEAKIIILYHYLTLLHEPHIAAQKAGENTYIITKFTLFNIRVIMIHHVCDHIHCSDR